jgi:2-keto-4-pentenoate hydratase/2-oxohepta-3-ene-1,7-dioic acid hydratase in catechol pathway
MKLVHYRTTQGIKLGVISEKGVIDLEKASQALLSHQPAPRLETFFTQGLALAYRALEKTDPAWLHDESTIVYAPCVPTPNRIFCVGLNYRRHAEETGARIPDRPIIFSKFNNSIAAHKDSIPTNPNAQQVDYEAELCVVIGKRAYDVREADALSHVFGYCNANDLSARDLQLATSQWLIGKTLDRYLPIGPYLVTAEDVPDPQNLSIACHVNGEVRQNSNTNDMIFSVAHVISYISRHIALEAGDIIITGTPEGVILGMQDKVWLKEGDSMTVTIEGMGALTNRMGASS